MYLDNTDTRDWAVAWSGGKDSTCVMSMVVKMLESLEPEQRKRKIHAVMSDTVMENPNLEQYMHGQVKQLTAYVEKKNLPVTVTLVIRELEQSYFYLVLGRGYFLPQNNGAGRWCTDRLKLQPQNKKLKEINPSYILIGTRLSESAKRRQSIEKWSGMNDLSYKIGDHANLSNTKTFMPIVDFTIEDVWEYLAKERLPWGSSHAVRTLYREATGECGFTNPKETEKKASQSESCGARFGCWTCPVILNDRSTEQMSETHPWMEPLSNWRMLQLKVFGDYLPIRPKEQRRKERSEVLRQWREINKEIKKVSKSGYKRNGKPMIDKNTGMVRVDQGTFTVEAREYLYEELLKTEDRVNEIRDKMGLFPLQLISEEEKAMIQQMWEYDRKHCPHLISNVNGFNIEHLKQLIETGEEIK
ncbi:phosphoadenosine phosphosulfate reductase family protein [Paenibacillus sp. JSM ZJ436]|uniref:phosphoadenosine phosphosulfate reductase domain-containing protein n=1 Tax=Paenibacillus sp. JSM ZJ436 TaxID=3376190 RepID=UPI0037946316